MFSELKLNNEYSDHTILRLNVDPIKIKQLNVAQLGRFQIFPHETHGFNWSSTLRTPSILIKISQKKTDLDILGKRLITIASDANLTIKERTEKLEKESHDILIQLQKLGFDTKSFKMVSNRLFNPGVSPNLLREKPYDYIMGPAFVLEDTDSFSNRMNQGFKLMLDDDADIITAQEVEFGESDGINFSEIHDSIMNKYNSYNYVTPTTQSNMTTTVTYYKKTSFYDVSDKYENNIKDLKQKLMCFGDSNIKTTIIMLKHITMHKIHTVINIHADYSKSNTESPWKILRNMFDTIPDLIVSGDFNLTLKNESFFRNAFADFTGIYKILLTPEPPEIGNPTYDLIIIS
jgi:hypothetical protein